jgi:predicted kinase
MYFILIHGLPATGKTTLGKQLAQSLDVPFFSRDAYKELLFDVLGTGDGTVDWSRKLGASSFEVLYLTLEALFQAGSGCVAETYWDAKFAEPRLKDLLSRYGIHCVQIFCKADSGELTRRFEERAHTTRHAAHMDVQRIEMGSHARLFSGDNERNRPLDVPCNLIEIDMSDFAAIDVPSIIQKIKQSQKRDR